jgi:hypothetical protein
MSADGFDAAMDAYAADESLQAEHFARWVDVTFGDGQVDSRLLRLEKIEEELLTETDPELRRRLLVERDQLDQWLADESIVEGDEDESIEERNARIRERDAATRQADRPGGTENDPSWIPRPRRPELRGGRAAIDDVARDAAAARRYIRAREADLGFAAGELAARPRRGKPTADASRRRAALASILAELRAKGATIETLAAASSRPVSVVHDLLSRAAG